VESPAAIAKSTDPSHSFGVTGWLRGIWNDKKMKKAFTIIELLVAMGLLAMLIAISGMVFSTAVKAYRTAGASMEVAAKLSALTDRLNRDFQSLPAGMPMAVWFEYEAASGRRYDQIQFFSDGDNFESSKQWAYIADASTVPPTTKTETLSGNAARVYYGQANNVRITPLYQRTFYRKYNDNSYLNTRERATEAILARRSHLLTSLSMQFVFPGTSFATFIPWTNGSLYGNDVFEYDNISLAEWKNILTVSANADQYLTTCFANPSSETPPLNFDGRPGVDLTASDGQSLHMVLAQGVGNFSVQLAYASEDMRGRSVPDSDLNRPGFMDIRWWPSIDPDANPTTLDSDFGLMGMNKGAFGCYMQFPGFPSPPTGVWLWYGTSDCLSQTNWRFASTYLPKALKFTFTLYDSNGVFKDGKTFTHIVYLK
jgi:prepilin-type N-terminal cleavage/methylation domain-containing protein